MSDLEGLEHSSVIQNSRRQGGKQIAKAKAQRTSGRSILLSIFHRTTHVEIMSPSTTAHEILLEDNYFLWEFNAHMALPRKDLLDHIQVKPEGAMGQPTAEWRAADLKALAMIAKLLSPVYQFMIREASSAAEA